MKELSISLNVGNEIEIIVISDTHIGSPQFNEGLLRDCINYIAKTKNCYCILNGDILDVGLPTSVADSFDNQMSPGVALSYACLLFEPIKKKILCTLGGNHDFDRSKKLTDISPSMALAVHLGIEDRFSADSFILYLTLENVKGKHNAVYSFFISHGRNGGGGRLAGSKANALEQMSLVIPTCDIYIHSHSHAPMTFKDEYYLPQPQYRSGTWKERLYVNTNAFLNYFNSYGEAKLYKPQSQSIPKIRLKVERKHNDRLDRLYKKMSCEI